MAGVQIGVRKAVESWSLSSPADGRGWGVEMAGRYEAAAGPAQAAFSEFVAGRLAAVFSTHPSAGVVCESYLAAEEGWSVLPAEFRIAFRVATSAGAGGAALPASVAGMAAGIGPGTVFVRAAG